MRNGVAILTVALVGFGAPTMAMRTHQQDGLSSEMSSSYLHTEKLDITIDNITNRDDITVFSNAEMAKGMMKPSKAFPLHLQYLVWMDQAGLYGESTGMPRTGALPDALVMVAQEGHEIGKDGKQTVSTCNKGWSWYYTDAGKKCYKEAREVKKACHYEVHWETPHRTVGSLFNFWGKDWLTPDREKWLNRFGLKLMPYWNCKLYGYDCKRARNVQCPPPVGAPRYPCAMWERSNTVTMLKIPVGTYYAFAVMDPDGNPIEPYYSEFLKAMEKLNVEAQFVGNDDHPDWD